MAVPHNTRRCSFDYFVQGCKDNYPGVGMDIDRTSCHIHCYHWAAGLLPLCHRFSNPLDRTVSTIHVHMDDNVVPACAVLPGTNNGIHAGI